MSISKVPRMPLNGRRQTAGNLGTKDMPARVGMSIDEIATPALIVDLDAFEANVAPCAIASQSSGVRLRAHAKTHKSVDIARYQIEHGGACGVCCQKVSEAETMVATAASAT